MKIEIYSKELCTYCIMAERLAEEIIEKYCDERDNEPRNGLSSYEFLLL